MADRGYSTLRAWVRSGDLHGHYADPERPSNSPLLVSKAELQALLVTSNKGTNPPRPPPARSPGDEPRDDSPGAELRTTLARIQVDLILARAERDGALAVNEAQRGTIAALEARCRDLASTVEAERARTLSAEAERDALRVERRLPWWRRLLGGPAPALSDDGGSTDR